MQINNISAQSTNFKSHFVPNEYLERAFQTAEVSCDRYFLQSVKAILNDGKSDKLELVKHNSRTLTLMVNGEIKGEEAIFGYYSNPAINLINRYAKKLTGMEMFGEKYNNLSPQEKLLIKEDADIIKLLSENIESSSNFVAEIQKLITGIKQKIDKNTKSELQTVKKAILGE